LLQIFKITNIKYFEKIIYPGLYPTFKNSIPLHYIYDFNKYFSIAGIMNLETIEKKNKEKIANTLIYEKYIDDELKINKFHNYNNNAFLEYPILLKKKNNKEVSKLLLREGYDIRHTWYVNNLKYKKLNHKINSYPNCEYLKNQILTLPTNNYFKESDIIKICNFINKIEKVN
jgi:dTDP-4-amino-4,6-dideoxygalactose transaminase